MSLQDRLFYVYSCDLDQNIQIRVGALEGKLEKPTYEQMIKDPSLQNCVALQDDKTNRQDLAVTCQVYCDGREVGIPVSTSYKCFNTRWNWHEWLILPVKYNELSRDAQLTLTIWDYHESVQPHAIGGTTVSFFSKRGVFRKGIYDLKVWPFEVGDGRIPSSTPGKMKIHHSTNPELLSDEEETEDKQMRRLNKMTKKHRSGLMEKVDWLDRLTFREIELINEREKKSTKSLFLMVEFPFTHHDNIEHLVIYYERNGDDLLQFIPNPTVVRCPDPELAVSGIQLYIQIMIEFADLLIYPQLNRTFSAPDFSSYLVQFDVNLVEEKHHILTRSARTGPADRELKPNAAVRNQLDYILQAPPSQELTSEQRDLIWKFRFYLSSNKKALTKFLQSVQWDQNYEVRQALELLKEWSPIDPEDALELLSTRYQHPIVRRYAVSRLAEASKDDLLLYLLQLVQALKYENINVIETGTDASFVQEFLENTTVKEKPTDERADLWSTKLGEEAEQGDADSEIDNSVEPRSVSPSTTDSGCESTKSDQPDLATFLISSACKDATLANYFFWYLQVECASCATETTSKQSEGDRADIKSVYVVVLRRLAKALFRGGTEAKRRRAQLMAQREFVDRTVQIMQVVAKESGNRRKKTEFLQAQLINQDSTVNFANLQGLPLPLDPEVRVQNVVADRARLFNSALMPCKLTFRTVDGKDFVTIFKHGDDLRQDQLVIQMIRLMDKLLRSENLDLRLTPYKVLATSLDDGFVQFIDSMPLRDVISEWNSVQEFFKFYRPSATGPYGIEPDVIENYVRSCAGYSVICYLLGIGDRHLHNLLLCKNGRLFHVDFGYILGRDPKPLPPPMKLTREMIDGMGGLNSNQWQEFRRLCYTAFLHLRRHANLILNLFSLMVDASIPDIAIEPDKAVKKIEERFHLGVNDEEAVIIMQHLIDASISAKMAAIADFVHDWAQILRN